MFAIVYQTQSLEGFSWLHIERIDGKAPIAVSGNNMYVVWWRNYEVLFKSSNDGGQVLMTKS